MDVVVGVVGPVVVPPVVVVTGFKPVLVVVEKPRGVVPAAVREATIPVVGVVAPAVSVVPLGVVVVVPVAVAVAGRADVPVVPSPDLVVLPTWPVETMALILSGDNALLFPIVDPAAFFAEFPPRPLPMEPIEVECPWPLEPELA